MTKCTDKSKMVNIGVTGKYGPGPGGYMLPPTVGYIKHDISKYRNPNYSFGLNLPSKMKGLGPGPQYNVENMTRVGKATSPEYSMYSRYKSSTYKGSPGPAAYHIKTAPSVPSYTLHDRVRAFKLPNYPAPNTYMLPTTIGPKIPDKWANAAYSMSYKHYLKTKGYTPGPSTYSPIDACVYKECPPKYTMGKKLKLPGGKSSSPGPIYHPKLPSCGEKGFSFGIKVENTPYITCADEIPCI